MSKFYAVSGKLSTGDMFSSVIWARTKMESLTHFKGREIVLIQPHKSFTI